MKHEAEAEMEGQRAVAQARKDKMLKVCHATLLLPLHSTFLYSLCCHFLHVLMLINNNALSSHSCFFFGH